MECNGGVSPCFSVNFNPCFDAAAPPENSLALSNSFISDGASFIELDPRLPLSRRFYRVSKDFSLDCIASSPRPLALAILDDSEDLLVTDACYLLPLFIDQISEAEPPQNRDQKNQSDNGASFETPMFVSSNSKREVLSGDDIHCASLRRCKSLSKRMFHKYRGFFRPIRRKFEWRRGFGSSVSGSSQQTDSSSSTTSPVSASVNKNEQKSRDSACSIHEAVLHCKRT